MAPGGGGDGGTELGCLVASAIEEDGAAAVGADLDETDALSSRGNAGGIAAQVDLGDASGAGVTEDEVAQGAAAVANDFGEALFGDGEDAAFRFARMADVEDAELEAADVLLHDGGPARFRQVPADLFARAGNHDAGAALADIGFEHDGEVGDLDRVAGLDQAERGNVWEVGQDRGLRFAGEASGRYAGIGRGEDGEGAVLEGEPQQLRDQG